MSKEDPYIQFPLCSLAWGRDTLDRLSHILGYGIYHAGTVNCADLQDSEEDQLVEIVETGRKIVECHTVDHINIQEEFEAIEEFAHHIGARFGNDKTVRIRVDIFWDVWNGDLAYEEFSFLCALSCELGNSDALRISRKTLRIRMLGYKSEPTMVGLIGQRTDGITPITEMRLRTLIKRMHGRGFFARLNPNRRHAWFSQSMTHERLAEFLLNREKGKTSYARSASLLENQIRKIIPSIVAVNSIVVDKVTTDNQQLTNSYPTANRQLTDS
jgi:hypothetical protein